LAAISGRRRALHPAALAAGGRRSAGNLVRWLTTLTAAGRGVAALAPSPASRPDRPSLSVSMTTIMPQVLMSLAPAMAAPNGATAWSER